MEHGLLMTVGLREKSMVFDEFADSEEVHAELLQAYPKLHSGAGYVTFSSHNQYIYRDFRYELLRTSESNTHRLKVIPPPPSGYTVAYLKSVTGQAEVYVRPLQKDLYESPAAEKETVRIYASLCTITFIPPLPQ